MRLNSRQSLFTFFVRMKLAIIIFLTVWSLCWGFLDRKHGNNCCILDLATSGEAVLNIYLIFLSFSFFRHWMWASLVWRSLCASSSLAKCHVLLSPESSHDWIRGPSVIRSLKGIVDPVLDPQPREGRLPRAELIGAAEISFGLLDSSPQFF